MDCSTIPAATTNTLTPATARVDFVFNAHSCLLVRVYPRSFAGKMGSFQSDYLHFAPVVVRILLVPSVRTLP